MLLVTQKPMIFRWTRAEIYSIWYELTFWHSNVACSMACLLLAFLCLLRLARSEKWYTVFAIAVSRSTADMNRWYWNEHASKHQAHTYWYRLGCTAVRLGSLLCLLLVIRINNWCIRAQWESARLIRALLAAIDREITSIPFKILPLPRHWSNHTHNLGHSTNAKKWNRMLHMARINLDLDSAITPRSLSLSVLRCASQSINMLTTFQISTRTVVRYESTTRVLRLHCGIGFALGSSVRCKTMTLEPEFPHCRVIRALYSVRAIATIECHHQLCGFIAF